MATNGSRTTTKRGAHVSPEAPPAKKRPCREEPDVIVRVGGHEFAHYRQILSFSSDFFDEKLNSRDEHGDKLSLVEFPDKDPKEWEIVAPFLEPVARAVNSPEAQVTEETVDILLDWFRELGMTEMLKFCDATYKKKTFPSRRNFCKRHDENDDVVLKEDLEKLFSILDKSVEYGLEETHERACVELARILDEYPRIFADEGSISKVVQALTFSEDRDPNEDLWYSVCCYLPENFDEKADPKLAASNALFPHLLKSGIDLHLAKVECNKKIEKIEALQKEKENAVAKGEKEAQRLLGVIKNLPDAIYDSLPNRKTLGCGDYKICSYAKRELKRIIASRLPNMVPKRWKDSM